MRSTQALSLKQATRRTSQLRALKEPARVSRGWIRFMRESLGMTFKNLGARARLGIPTVQQAERNEVAGKITLNSLRQLAEAMECELVYAFVPKLPLEKTIEAAARAKAERLLQVADTHMTLENQKVDRALEERVKQLASALLDKGDIW